MRTLLADIKQLYFPRAWLLLSSLLLLLLPTLHGCWQQSRASTAEPRPLHHSEDGFRNPYLQDEQKSLISYLLMRLTTSETYADHTEEIAQIRVATTSPALDSFKPQPLVTWLGHSTFLIRYQGKTLLTDPILSKRASPLSFAGPKRLAPLPYKPEDLPPIDVVIISHNHYDHLDLETVRALGDDPRYIVPLGLKKWFVDNGIAAAQVDELDWWESRSLDGMALTATPSQHWSGRGAFDRYDSLWAAWRIDIGDFSVWFGGDTGYNPIQFRETADRLGPVDLALIPIGAYAPRWFMKSSHVNPEEAIDIHHDIKSTLSIGMHWSTFQLSAEPLDEPRQKLQALVKEGALQRGRFITVAIGETLPITDLASKKQREKNDSLRTTGTGTGADTAAEVKNERAKNPP